MLDDLHIPLIEEIHKITTYLSNKIHQLSMDSSTLKDAYSILPLINMTTEKDSFENIINEA